MDLRDWARTLGYDVAIGTGIGLIVLGVGGRVAMRLIALASGTPPGWTLGGTSTVVFLGAVSGAGGALLLAVSHAAAGWIARGAGAAAWTRHTLFATLLLLVTLRGLHGSPRGSYLYFLPLVAVYGVLMERASRRRRPVAALTPASPS